MIAFVQTSLKFLIISNMSVMYQSGMWTITALKFQLTVSYSTEYADLYNSSCLLLTLHYHFIRNTYSFTWSVFNMQSDPERQLLFTLNITMRGGNEILVMFTMAWLLVPDKLVWANLETADLLRFLCTTFSRVYTKICGIKKNPVLQAEMPSLKMAWLVQAGSQGQAFDAIQQEQVH